jgi:hypothetical protein
MDDDGLVRLIDALETQAGGLDSTRPDWKGIWSQIREISTAFKGAHFSSRAEHQAAWERFQSTVQTVKDAQARHQREREQFRQRSSDHLAEIRVCVDRAAGDDQFAMMIIHAATGGATLMAKLALDAVLGPGDEEHSALAHRSEALKDGWAYLSAHKSEMSGADKSAAFEALQNAKQSLDRDWGLWKEYKHQARVAKAELHRAKQEEWRARQREFVQRLEDALDRLEAARARREDHLAELIDKYNDARSDSFRERVEGWIAEEKERIAGIEQKIEDVRSKLSEAVSRLNS